MPQNTDTKVTIIRIVTGKNPERVSLDSLEAEEREVIKKMSSHTDLNRFILKYDKNGKRTGFEASIED